MMQVIDLALKTVESSGRYQILKCIDRQLLDELILEAGLGIERDPQRDLRVATILDTETTGTDGQAEIIQLSMLKFAYDADTGRVVKVLASFDAYNQPSKPIPPETIRLTGITNEMVQGHSLDIDAVEEFMCDCDLVIAHKADFDRPVMERNILSLQRVFAQQRWACSLTEIDWQAAGYTNSKLDYLLFKHGFAYEAHRADIDCIALLVLLTQQHEGVNYLKRLHDSAAEASYKLWATFAPFETKDVLKSRGYKWHDGSVKGDHKAWAIVVNQHQVAAEMAFLEETIYKAPFPGVIDTADATLRYSILGPREREELAKRPKFL